LFFSQNFITGNEYFICFYALQFFVIFIFQSPERVECNNCQLLTDQIKLLQAEIQELKLKNQKLEEEVKGLSQVY